jgi:exonuclease SbcC
MKLRSLGLVFFRQHINTKVVFPDGLVGIIGPNGSGKTTIVEAISFALFGSRALRGRTEDVRTRHAPTRSGKGKRDTELRVELTLEHEESVYRVERTLNDAALYVGGEAKPVATGNRDVSARVSAIVGMSYEEFIATYCTEQKGLEFLSGKKGATEREKFIVRMMGYDRLEQLQELIRDDRKDRRGVLVGFEASIGSREELELRLQAEEQELQQVQQRHAEAAAVLQKNESDFTHIRERMVRREDLRARFLRDREAVQTLTVRRDEGRKRIQGLVQSASLIQEELALALQPLAGGQALDEALSAAKKRVALEKDRLGNASDVLRGLELTSREAMATAAAERDGVKAQLVQLRKRIDNIGKLNEGHECPTCGQELGESFEQVRAHFQREERDLNARLEVCEEKVKQAGMPTSELEAARKGVSDADHQVKLAEARLQEIAKCEQLQSTINALHKERGQLEGETRATEELLERAEAALVDLRYSEDEYLREKGSFDAAQRLLEVARLQRVRLEGEVNTKEAMVERTKKELVRYDERRVEGEQLRHEVRVLDECDRIVTEFRKYVNTAIRPRLAELASEYLADLTDGRYSAVELGEDFTPTVIEDGEPKRVISGGEEDILNLCMRVSLSHMLAERAGQHFSLLLLDEVFGSLDEGRRSNVLGLLEKLRKRFDQILVITHLDDIKESVQHLVQVEYDELTGRAYVASWEDLEAETEEMAFNV